MEQRRNARRGKREIPEKTRRPAASSSTIATCENPGVTLPGIEPCSPWWEASSLTAQSPRPPFSGCYSIGLRAEKLRGDKGEISKCMRCAIAATRKAPNLRELFSSRCVSCRGRGSSALLGHPLDEVSGTSLARVRCIFCRRPHASRTPRLRCLNKTPSPPEGRLCRDVHLSEWRDLGGSLNIEVLRADVGEARRVLSKMPEVPRGNPPTSGIVLHDSHIRKTGETPPEIEPGSPCWEASSLTTTPPSLQYK
ncbi:hypothetical protein PR048_029659 [Dryococelus australis]|uniref:Uncharacterized protein n=1 Tax=Dryococelus australis TaxID=614101 RepID=A0ABQ9GE18_9NEOP|nr:hypothetical protein PR048_029659 [Dryococelus australis]